MLGTTRRLAAAAGVTAIAAGGALAAASTSATAAARPGDNILFAMTRSSATVAARCLPHASASVRVINEGPVERMRIRAHGLPANTGFDTFVIQVPDAPFGVSWYQGDLESDRFGNALQEYVGRFNIETFAVAPGTAPAPNTHPGLDATSNPAFKPVHTYHVGIWFNSPRDAVKAHCLGATTPFNGDHNAGVQVLSTRNFPATAGPLSRLRP